jgi:hypothetical protein
MREWCWLQTVWYSVRSFVRTGRLTPIVGHEYVPTTDWDVLARVQVAQCSRCGAYSVGWYHAQPVGAPSCACPAGRGCPCSLTADECAERRSGGAHDEP